SPENPDILAAAAVAEGCVGRALAFLDGEALELRKAIMDLLDRLPAVDPRALHALGDRLYGVEAAPLKAFIDTVNGWLSGRLLAGAPDRAPLARGAEAGNKITGAARGAGEYN